MSLPDSSTMLEVHDMIVQRGGSTVLALPHLAVDRGETLAIIGPNGAGKSTLLLAMALLLSPKTGTVSVGGEAATRDNGLSLRRRMAVVFQEPLLLDTSVAENVATGLKLRGVAREERQKLVALSLDRFGISSLATRAARTLSGGEAQRASLARAFALAPEVLFLDEPFSALDAPTRAALAADLSAVLRATQTTTVLVTHDRDEALALASRIAILIDGRLRQIGPPESVFSTPQDGDVASFVGVETIAHGAVIANVDGVAQVQLGDRLTEVVSPLAPGTSVLFCLRPEDVTLHRVTSASDLLHSSARNNLVGKVQSLSPSGALLRVTVDCGFPLVAAITRRSASELDIVEGTPVVASFKATSAHLISR